MSRFLHPFWVPFSSLLVKSGPRGPGPHPKMPTRHQHGPQGYPNGAPGCRNEVPRSPQSAQKTPNCISCVSKWRPKVPQWIPKATQSTKETPQGPSKYHKDNHRCQQAQLDTNALGKAPGGNKNTYKPPAAGCSPQASTRVDLAAGRGTTNLGRLHVETP